MAADLVVVIALKVSRADAKSRVSADRRRKVVSQFNLLHFKIDIYSNILAHLTPEPNNVKRRNS